MQITLCPITEARFDEMLDKFPPMDWTSKGFLVAEPCDYRICTVTEDLRTTFSPFFQVGANKFFAGNENLTRPEFAAVTPAQVDQAARAITET